MKFQDLDEKIIDSLYQELFHEETHLSSAEESGQNFDLQKEIHQSKKVCHLYRNRLPHLKASASLQKQTLKALGLRRPWYEVFQSSAWLKPSLVGAMVLALTLGVTYYRSVSDPKLNPIQSKSSIATVQALGEKIAQANSHLKPQDLQLAAQAMELKLQKPRWRETPRLGGGLVSLASYGSAPSPSYDDYDIRHLDQEADFAVAQFAHQQALRLRARGDYAGAAIELSKLIKKYPSYPYAFQAVAQRIDCLFRSNQAALARKELSMLRTHSPDLAHLVEQRWKL